MHAFQTAQLAAQHRTDLEAAARTHRLVRSARPERTPAGRPARRTWRRVTVAFRHA